MVVQVRALRHADEKIAKIERIRASRLIGSLRVLFGSCLSCCAFLRRSFRAKTLRATDEEAGPDKAVSSKYKKFESGHRLRVYITRYHPRTSRCILNSNQDDLELRVDASACAAYIWALFLSACGRRCARALVQVGRKKNGNSTGIARRCDHVHDDVVHHRREPADSGGGRDANRGRPVRDVHFGGRGDSGDGFVGELSDCARAGNVPERVFHLLGRAGQSSAVADCPRCRFYFRLAVSSFDVNGCSRTNRQWHTRLPEIQHSSGHRTFHCLCWSAKRETGGRTTGDIRRPWKFFRS